MNAPINTTMTHYLKNTLVNSTSEQIQPHNSTKKHILLEFQIRFNSGEDQLSMGDHIRMDMLAGYLLRHPAADILADGYTDARGTDEYNFVLSAFRAKAIADALIKRGINSQRIYCQGLGAKTSSSSLSRHIKQYTQDRYVNIQVVV